MLLRWLVFCTILLLPFASSSDQTLTPHQQIAFDIYKELVEINTVTATGDTELAAAGDGRPSAGGGLRRFGCAGVLARATQRQSSGAIARDGKAQADPAPRPY